MKKKIWIPALAITLLAMGYVAYAWGRLDTCPGKVWLHRCNSVEKLEEMSGRYPNVEVDICLRDGGVPDVTHDIDTTFHLGLTPYMDYLAHDPTRHMWLDVKNLNEGNQAAFIHVLDSMVKVHGVNKGQLVIESPEWQLLFPLTRAHYYTSCYVTAPRPSRLSQEQKDSVLVRLNTVARSGCVCALSFPAYWYNSLRRQFRDTDIDYLTWMHHHTQMGMWLDPLGETIMNDRRVKVLLVKSKGHYHR